MLPALDLGQVRIGPPVHHHLVHHLPPRINAPSHFHVLPQLRLLRSRCCRSGSMKAPVACVPEHEECLLLQISCAKLRNSASLGRTWRMCESDLCTVHAADNHVGGRFCQTRHIDVEASSTNITSGVRWWHYMFRSRPMQALEESRRRWGRAHLVGLLGLGGAVAAHLAQQPHAQRDVHPLRAVQHDTGWRCRLPVAVSVYHAPRPSSPPPSHARKICLVQVNVRRPSCIATHGSPRLRPSTCGRRPTDIRGGRP